MSPSRALARTVSDSIRLPVFSLGATSSSIACMIEGTPAITMTLPIQKPGAPDGLVVDQVGALRGCASCAGAPRSSRRRWRQALLEMRDRLAGRWSIAHAERLGDAVGGDVVMGRPDAAGGEDVGVAMAQRIERGDDRPRRRRPRGPP